MDEEELEEDPNDPETLRKKGIRLHSRGEFEEALDAFNDTLELNPDGPEAWLIWLKKGMTFRYQRKYNEAVESFDRAIQINPYLPELWQNKADALYLMDRLKKAKECFIQADTLCSELKDIGSHTEV